MQIEIYKVDDIEKKAETRKLYEECFDEGKDEFIDYYYSDIIKRNEMVVVKEDNEVVSMIHLNPYSYDVFGKKHKVHYLVAIATREKCRRKGLMKKVLQKAVEYLKEKKEPFCYLVPENEELIKLYSKYGFSVVCNFTLDKFKRDSYDIHPDYNPEYIDLMKKEQYFLDMESEEYKLSLRDKKVMFRLLSNDFELSIDKLKEASIYVCQEV